MKRVMISASLAAGLLCSCAGQAQRAAVPDTSAQLIKARSGVDTTLAGDPQRQQLIQRLLADPLTSESAQQIALINNPALLATYFEAGIAAADLQQAGLPGNPGFTFNHTRADGDAVIDRTWSLSLVSLITAPLAKRIESDHYEQVKLDIADAALKVASATKIAWIEAIAAQQNLDYARQTNDAAQAGAALAEQMRAAGNWSALEQQREQLFSLQSATALAQAELDGARRRERLGQLLGLELDHAQTSYRLPEHMPDLPSQPYSIENIETVAMAQRLDVQASLLETQRVARSLDLTRSSAWLNVLDVGPARNTGPASASFNGYQITVSVPLFDWGQAKSNKAEALYMQSVYRTAAVAQNARAQVRFAWLNYQSSYRLARQYREEIVPLQRNISSENLLRYNAMLISVFDLLADARSQVAVVNADADALKQFWIADATLQAELGGALPTNLPQPTTTP